MTDKTDKANDTQPSVEELQKQLDRANSIIALSQTEKSHFDSLEGEVQDAFLAKSSDERKAEIESVSKAKQDADPVLYTTADGVELRKSAGEALIAMAKANDAIAKENSELRAQREQDSLEKRAEEELSHLPGDVKTRAAMLKAVESISDEDQRKAALDALKANNNAMGEAFEAHGVSGQSAPSSADSELNQLAKELAEKGKELYAQTIN